MRYPRRVTTFNLRPLKLRPGEEHRETVAVDLEPFELGGERYVLLPERPEARLTIARTTSGSLFRLAFRVSLCGPDAREYQAEGADSEELSTPYLEHQVLDLSAWARDAVALSLPEKILCREECAGLCAGCGANLNVEACRCPPPEPEAPLAKLAELRDLLS